MKHSNRNEILLRTICILVLLGYYMYFIGIPLIKFNIIRNELAVKYEAEQRNHDYRNEFDVYVKIFIEN